LYKETRNEYAKKIVHRERPARWFVDVWRP
jgi:hypothetical protein